MKNRSLKRVPPLGGFPGAANSQKLPPIQLGGGSLRGEAEHRYLGVARRLPGIDGLQEAAKQHLLHPDSEGFLVMR
ncbi:MAG: hypothetical protein GEU94_10870 [Micromonosporaceae bacterium]|nr:hypothetical protein [Micromonosporaceae bacterium]